MSGSVWPHRWLPTRLLSPQDSLGKSTGVGCHFLLRKEENIDEGEAILNVWKWRVSRSDVSDSLLHHRLPGSSVHEILQVRILECGAISSSKGSSLPSHWTQVSCIAGIFLTIWATTRKPLGGSLCARFQVHMLERCTAHKRHGEGNGNPLQYSCLKNPVDRGAWWAAVCMVAQSQTRLKWLSMHACIGDGNGNPLQYSCLENPRDRGAWWAAVCGVAQSQTRLNRFSSSSRR